MKIKTPVDFQTFTDGICKIYQVVNAAEAGDRPKDGLRVMYERVPYERRTVGVTRFYQAAQADVKIEALIRIPYQPRIGTNHICEINGLQYRIRQAQEIKETMPQATDLSLERLEVAYDIGTVS
ncbi:MAG: hypothetical protein J6I64_07405 [Lachnospiraceae bacterium]|nr:hypothetical protein [Lachnospiraceae bacterium]